MFFPHTKNVSLLSGMNRYSSIFYNECNHIDRGEKYRSTNKDSFLSFCVFLGKISSITKDLLSVIVNDDDIHLYYLSIEEQKITIDSCAISLNVHEELSHNFVCFLLKQYVKSKDIDSTIDFFIEEFVKEKST